MKNLNSLFFILALLLLTGSAVIGATSGGFGLKKIAGGKLEGADGTQKFEIEGIPVEFQEFPRGKQGKLKFMVPEGTTDIIIRFLMASLNSHDRERTVFKVNGTNVETFYVYVYDTFKAPWYTLKKRGQVDKIAWPDQVGQVELKFKVDTKKKVLTYIKPKNRGKIKIAKFDGKEFKFEFKHTLNEDKKNESFGIGSFKVYARIQDGPSIYNLQLQDQLKSASGQQKNLKNQYSSYKKESTQQFRDIRERFESMGGNFKADTEAVKKKAQKLETDNKNQQKAIEALQKQQKAMQERQEKLNKKLVEVIKNMPRIDFEQEDPEKLAKQLGTYPQTSPPVAPYPSSRERSSQFKHYGVDRPYDPTRGQWSDPWGSNERPAYEERRSYRYGRRHSATEPRHSYGRTDPAWSEAEEPQRYQRPMTRMEDRNSIPGLEPYEQREYQEFIRSVTPTHVP